MDFLRRKYTLGEELFNAITHGIGALLSVAGCVVLLVRCHQLGDSVAAVSSAIYGTTLIILYTMSTLYHALANEKAKAVFRVFDHVTIYLLIAGTYTPYTLACLGGALGWTLFGIVWAAAIVGIVFSSISLRRFQKLSMICYIAMGWVCVLAFTQIVNSLSPAAFGWLLAGGIIYTVGGIIYALKVPLFDAKHKNFGSHEIFHLFVMAGSACHFILMYVYIA